MALKDEIEEKRLVELKITETLQVTKKMKSDIDFLLTKGISMEELILLSFEKLSITKFVSEFKSNKIKKT